MEKSSPGITKVPQESISTMTPGPINSTYRYKMVLTPIVCTVNIQSKTFLELSSVEQALNISAEDLRIAVRDTMLHLEECLRLRLLTK